VALDALEVALLNATTLAPLIGVASGLTDTDAILNIQASGQSYVSPQVKLWGLNQSGDTISLEESLTVQVDLSGVPAGSLATLYFDLLGFGDLESSVTVDDIVILSAEGPPTTLQLAPESDSGIVGDNRTDFGSVSFIGTTDPAVTVLLDLDGDGFDDGQASADASVITGSSTHCWRMVSIRFASKAGTAPATSIVSVEIERDGNHAPSGIDITNRTVKERLSGAVLGILSASDVDEGSRTRSRWRTIGSKRWG